MDVLKPDYVWIENRRYRNLHIKDYEPESYIEEDRYPTQNYYNEEKIEEEEEEEGECLHIKYEKEKFWISLPVPGILIGYVCGKQSNNIKRIEKSTNTLIKIPVRMNGGMNDRRNRSKAEKSSDFVITAEKRASVAGAYRQLRDIMSFGRWKVADFTHFISIPINSQSIQERFLNFQRSVSSTCHSARGIKEAVFTHPDKLHLTIVMLTLLDDREKEDAKAALNDCRSQIMKMLGGRTLRLLVQGIEYMNDDDAEVDVLYGKVSEPYGGNVLQIIAEKLSQVFSDVSLAQTGNSVKLHVTLLKSKGTEEGRNSFDARPILQKFKEYVFGELELKEVHISTRKTGHQKYYTPLTIITF